jgi:hypothetical protein
MIADPRQLPFAKIHGRRQEMSARLLVVVLLFSSACTPPESTTSPVASPSPKPAVTVKQDPPVSSKKVEIGKNVTFEITAEGRRRVLVNGLVCLREGPLEMFLCRRFTKEHESVVCADIDARDLHKALLLAGAVAGSPVKFEPYQAATGSVIKVTVRYKDDGEEKTIDARGWVRDVKSGKELDKDWVFAGSFFFSPEFQDEKASKKQLYAANGGEVVCVSNFATAMMDLPIQSTDQNEDLMFEAFKGRIPPLGTSVIVIFEPQPEKKESMPVEKKNP